MTAAAKGCKVVEVVPAAALVERQDVMNLKFASKPTPPYNTNRHGSMP